MKTYFTSESVTCGHPDKVCDQIADAVLDDILANDPDAHVACEVTACTGEVHLMGEITSSYVPDYEAIARKVIAEIGYTAPVVGFDAENVRIRVSIHTQSPDIARGVDRGAPEEAGAGDQGMMFGYACRETDALMPLSITLANRLTRRLEQVRREKLLPYLLPDGKAQVSVEYENGKSKRISAVVVSAQHSAEVGIDALRERICGKVSAFAGNSGVGKSTLVGALEPGLALRTGSISESHRKGRHTTTFSAMYPLTGGGFLIDTPGIKGFGLIDIDDHELWHYFPEMMRIGAGCRFYNCTHTHEPGCAVREAVERGEVARSRYESYLKIRDEDDKYRK